MKQLYDIEYYVDGKKPIARSTKATSDLLALLKAKAKSWQELKSMIHYDPDAIKVIDAYIESGINFKEVILK